MIADGEVLQLMNSGNPDLDEASYLAVIQRKTAKLFEAAAQLGAVLGGASPEAEAALARYGMHLGTAFQLVDDVLDYSGDLEAIGKNLGDDLAEGKMTLPLIRAIAVGGDEAGAMIRGAITDGRLDDFASDRRRALAHRRARLHAAPRASARAKLAAACLADLPLSPYRESLLELSAFASRRTY